MSIVPPAAPSDVSGSASRLRLPLIEELLREQQELTAVERFARDHDTGAREPRYKALLPATPPGAGQQYAFEVDLDACSGCKACVTACHSLNGLDDGETWRSVGLLHGGSAAAPVRQTVTTACHHCLEPACMTGCPVAAYEKDLITGIVRHLDDQCIGCQYCTFTCPYEVPQYNAKRGIVRKCDMCSGRLAAGEAPACVQACPNEAISITLVDRRQVLEDAQGDAFLPGAPSPSITVPTTVYRTVRPPPRNLLPADYYQVAPAERHMPLVLMLVLTQLSVGAFAVDTLVIWWFASELRPLLAPTHALIVLSVGLAALGASVFHLGRPLYAFRAVIGLRTSWMSREIVAFGAFALLAVIYAGCVLLELGGLPLHKALRATVGLFGLAGIVCSVAIYHATKKPWWTASRTAFKFFMTAALLGTATMLVALGAAGIDNTALPSGSAASPGGAGLVDLSTGFARTLANLLVAASAIKLAGELSVFAHLGDKRYTDLKRSALLMIRDLRSWTVARFALLITGGIALPLLNTDGAFSPMVLGLVMLVLGEFAERTLFFAAARSPGMPGGLR